MLHHRVECAVRSEVPQPESMCYGSDHNLIAFRFSTLEKLGDIETSRHEELVKELHLAFGIKLRSESSAQDTRHSQQLEFYGMLMHKKSSFVACLDFGMERH